MLRPSSPPRPNGADLDGLAAPGFPSRVGGLLAAALAAAIALVATGCSSEGKSPGGPAEAESRSGQPETTIVFVDPTTREEAMDAFADSLRGLAQSHLVDKGDQIKAYQIRKRTAIKTPQLVIENEIDPPEKSQFVDRTAMRKARVQQKRERLMQRADSLLGHFLETASIENSPSSDLFGALEVLLEEQEGEGPIVYFFSDMYHVGPDDIRNFEYQAPESQTEAQTWAERDAKQVRRRLPRREGQEAALPPETTIRMVPAEGAKRTESPSVEMYWRTLFERLGVKPDHISYN